MVVDGLLLSPGMRKIVCMSKNFPRHMPFLYAVAKLVDRVTANLKVLVVTAVPSTAQWKNGCCISVLNSLSTIYIH